MRPTASLALKSQGRRNNKDKGLESTRSGASPCWLRSLCRLHAFYTPLLLIHSEWLILWLTELPEFFFLWPWICYFIPPTRQHNSQRRIYSFLWVFFNLLITYCFFEIYTCICIFCRITCANWKNRSLLRQPLRNPRTECEHRENSHP